jgi:hypothetical protein
MYLNIYPVRSREDRRRLVQLLQLAEPIEQTIKLYYDKRPEKLEKYSRNDFDPESIALSKSITSNANMSGYSTNKSLRSNSSKKTVKSNILKKNSSNNPLEYRIPTSDEKQQILRTILFPNHETVNTQNEENDFLKKQLIDMKRFYETQISKMEEERRLREEEIRLFILNSKEREEDLLKKNQKLEKLNYELTKDYMQLKYDSSNNERKLYEELELVKLQNEALGVSLKELSSKVMNDKEHSKNDYDRKTKEITNVMRNQVKSHEENNNIIKEQYKQIQKIYTTRVKELEDKIKALQDKYKNLEQKRNYEIEGYINEIALMRKRVRSYEEYLYKLRRMAQGSEDRLSEIDSNLKSNSEKFFEETNQFKVNSFNISLIWII